MNWHHCNSEAALSISNSTIRKMIKKKEKEKGKWNLVTDRCQRTTWIWSGGQSSSTLDAGRCWFYEWNWGHCSNRHWKMRCWSPKLACLMIHPLTPHPATKHPIVSLNIVIKHFIIIWLERFQKTLAFFNIFHWFFNYLLRIFQWFSFKFSNKSYQSIINQK